MGLGAVRRRAVLGFRGGGGGRARRGEEAGEVGRPPATAIGVLAPRAGWRAALVPAVSHEVDLRDWDAWEDGDASCAHRSRAGAYQWAELMRRTFGVDVLACPRCQGRLCLVALIDQAPVIQRILRHLGLPTDVPEPCPARPPPWPLGPIEDQSHDALEFDAAW